LCNLGRSTVRYIIQKYKVTGTIVQSAKGSDKRSKLTQNEKAGVISKVNENPTMTLKQLQFFVASQYNKTGDDNIVDGILKTCHYSLKRITPIPVARNTEAAIIKRFDYSTDFTNCSYNLDDANFIFIDEVEFQVATRTKRSRSKIGTSVSIETAAVRTRNISIIASASKNGMIYYKNNIIAVNGINFCLFIEELLINGEN
ncbi:hypothetical protein DMUE_4989, partial [Dictyocoela muelleri]